MVKSLLHAIFIFKLVSAYSYAGDIDIVDDYLLNGYIPKSGLKTKIASKTDAKHFLDAIWLAEVGSIVPTPYYSVGDTQVLDMPILFYVYNIDTPNDESSCTTQRYQLIGNDGLPLVAVLKAGDTSARTTSIYTVEPNAERYSKIVAKYINFYGIYQQNPTVNCLVNGSNSGNIKNMPQCVDSRILYAEAFGEEAAAKCFDGVNGSPCTSSNGYGEYEHDLGCYQCTLESVKMQSCSSDAFAIRPAEFYSTIAPNQEFKASEEVTISFEAKDFLNNTTYNYNEPEGNTFIADINISDAAKVCQEAFIKFFPSILFVNGIATDGYKLRNVGDFNVTISEKIGFEFAHVDSDDTDITQRFISPLARSIKVIPHHFGVDGNISNAANGYTYLSNFEIYNTYEGQNVSASFNLNLLALSLDENITSNYTSRCYAKSGDITLTLKNPIKVTPIGSLSKIIWSHSSLEVNGSIPITQTTHYQLPFLDTYFDNNETNGTAQINYKINFDRNVIKAVNPFIVEIDEINATDADLVNGFSSVDSNATFIYGRTHVSRQRYESNTPRANIYYESYCFETLDENDCNKTLLPNGVNSKRVDDLRWFINENHTASQGSAGAVTQRGANIVTATHATGNHQDFSDLAYGNSSYPYKTTMQNSASPWLIYNKYDSAATKNEFSIELNSPTSGSWSGERKTDTNTRDVGTPKTNRRIMW